VQKFRAAIVGLCAAATAATVSTAQSVDLTGAGSTFVNPIFSRWVSDYARLTGVKINYQPIGSGGGIRQISEETVDFGATDGPMTNEELAKAKGGPILHFPIVLGAVVISYNLPSVVRPLNLTGDIISGIYQGKILKWNDARIQAANPGVRLPATDVLVVHRSDGSGTTYIFTDYLSTVSKAWAAGPGRGKEVKWPVGLGGKGNDGVAGQVKQLPGAIGYIELAYAKQNHLPFAHVLNAAGVYVAPSVPSTTGAAAASAGKLPRNTDYRISIVNAPGKASYPIASFSWLLAYQHQKDAAKGKKLVNFLHWAFHDGQKLSPTLDYAPLPAAMVTDLDRRLKTIKIGG
jgi:phosphate transport system substrate-binding protein